MNVLKREKRVLIAKLLTEGCSIRGTARAAGVDKDTVERWLLKIGQNCQRILDENIQGVRTPSVEADECWMYIGKKQSQVKLGDPHWMGDCYLFLAVCSKTKLVISHTLGKRDARNTHRFMEDVSRRVDGRTQLSVDGWKPYIPAIRRHFNGRADAMAVVKNFHPDTTEEHRRYGPPRFIGMNRHWISGFPRHEHASTSRVERSNWTWRTISRRMTRLSNGFSRSPTHLEAQIALMLAAYNFCRRHRTLRMPPAMAAGITREWWDIDRLVP